jgi:hypothetical protein
MYSGVLGAGLQVKMSPSTSLDLGYKLYQVLSSNENSSYYMLTGNGVGRYAEQTLVNSSYSTFQLGASINF